ncbi:hypothetical protein SAMN04488510_1369 [Fervidobacterium changbaicum]|uniref:DUF503 domain-containing protein n=2 Tax=Fervidobacterium TaxID=2422 RepID=A0AAI8CL99_FERIS|nr:MULTISPECIES: DUF503 domain-containing protein [Fervidobacterium]AMW32656.1 DUF503 domain-containing protein [Fervidobacterium islandicum]QAV32690.1 DUF503 domain-containing protein [Fervidobacterium changbaicum]SDH80195.1 hypothetical protein SAMN04488510_1369 [Fervidobacterium changbaicum]
MVVGYGTILIKLFGVNSLKEKRSIVRSLVNDLKKRFEISAIESGRQDSKDYILIGIAFATLSENDAEAKLDSIETYVESRYTIEEFTYDFHHF